MQGKPFHFVFPLISMHNYQNACFSATLWLAASMIAGRLPEEVGRDHVHVNTARCHVYIGQAREF